MFFSCVRSSRVADDAAFRDADVILKVVPMTAKVLSRDTVIDVMEKAEPDQMERLNTVVVFKINKILKGEFTKIRRGGPSRLKQAQQAMTRGKVLKLMTLDFTDPDEIIEKRWVNVAVENAFTRFQISDWEDPPDQLFLLYLKRLPEQTDSFK